LLGASEGYALTANLLYEGIAGLLAAHYLVTVQDKEINTNRDRQMI